MKRESAFKILMIILLALAVVWTSPQKNSKEKDLKIGILQLAEHEALDAARIGFIESLEKQGYKEGENVEIEYLNAQGDQSNLKVMSDRLVADKVDLILAIATPAAQAVANATTDIPILVTAVTDPKAAKLVESNEKPNTNVSGTSDMTPVAEQLKLLKQLVPNVKNVGFIYNSSEANSKIQIDIADKVAKELGLQTTTMTVTNTNDVAQNTEALVKRVDAIYIPTDNTMASAMATVGNISKRTGIPVINGEESVAKIGGLATVGVNYKKLGEQTGEMAGRILSGKEKVESMPIEYQKDYDVYINEDIAKALNITIPEELKK